jgi:hypothetical protein
MGPDFLFLSIFFPIFQVETMVSIELVLRIKMIDAREIAVTVPREGRVADIAEAVLEAEDAPMNKMIRLIFGGRLLQPQDAIAASNINDYAVIHAVITDAPTHPQFHAMHHGAAHGARPPQEPPRLPHAEQWTGNSSAGSMERDQLEGMLMKLPPGIILVLLWYIFLARGGDLFSWFSTMSLVILTFLYFSYTLPRTINGPLILLENAFVSLYSYTSSTPGRAHQNGLHPHQDGRLHLDVSSIMIPHLRVHGLFLIDMCAHSDAQVSKSKRNEVCSCFP